MWRRDGGQCLFGMLSHDREVVRKCGWDDGEQRERACRIRTFLKHDGWQQRLS
jgi:hypothetical protein